MLWEFLWEPIGWAWKSSIHLEKLNEVFIFWLFKFVLKNMKRESKIISYYMERNACSTLLTLLVFSTITSVATLRLAHPKQCRIRDQYLPWTFGNTDSSLNREMQERELCQRQWDSMWKALPLPSLHGTSKKNCKKKLRLCGKLPLVDWNSIPLGKCYAQKHTSVKIFLLFLQKINLANYRSLRREWHTVRKKKRQQGCSFLTLLLILGKVLDIP